MKRALIFDFRFSIFAFTVFIALGCTPRQADAQFLGYAGQQTVTKSIGVSAGAPTPQTAITLPNYGQAAHSFIYKWDAAAVTCTLYLQGSGNGTQWRTLAAGPALGANEHATAFANGYFPFLRILVNPGGTIGCTAGVTLEYAGYQTPVIVAEGGNPVKSIAVSTAVRIGPAQIVADNVPGPTLLNQFTCYNPNASVAYLQFYDSAGNPTLGASNVWQVGIPATSVFTYPGPAMAFSGKLFAAAVTAADGNAAVGSSLVCGFNVNVFGPFPPAIGLNF